MWPIFFPLFLTAIIFITACPQVKSTKENSRNYQIQEGAIKNEQDALHVQLQSLMKDQESVKSEIEALVGKLQRQKEIVRDRKALNNKLNLTRTCLRAAEAQMQMVREQMREELFEKHKPRFEGKITTLNDVMTYLKDRIQVLNEEQSHEGTLEEIKQKAEKKLEKVESDALRAKTRLQELNRELDNLRTQNYATPVMLVTAT